MASWKERQFKYANEREQGYIASKLATDAKYSKFQEKRYKDTIREIETQINAFTGKYATKEGLTIEEVRKRVSRFDVEAFRDKAKQYVAEKNFGVRANEELRLYNLTMRTSRLELLKREINLELIALADLEEKELEKRLNRESDEELKRQAGILALSINSIAKIKNRADVIASSSFHNAKFSDRIWANQKALQYELNKGIERSILLGENPKKWSSNLTKFVKKEMTPTGKENALYYAQRLAITESARVQSEIQLSSFREGGFEYYIWIAEPTACEHCMPLNGEIFSVEDANVGFETPPLHPFCRCSIAAYYEEK